MRRVSTKSNVSNTIVYVVVFIIIAIIVAIVFKKQSFKTDKIVVPVNSVVKPTKKISEKKEEKKVPVKKEITLDYNKLKTDSDTTNTTKERKLKYGIGEGIDLIVRPSESFKVGKITVSMQEVLEKVVLSKGGLLEKNIRDDIINNTVKPNKSNINKDAINKNKNNIMNIGDTEPQNTSIKKDKIKKVVDDNKFVEKNISDKSLNNKLIKKDTVDKSLDNKLIKKDTIDVRLDSNFIEQDIIEENIDNQLIEKNTINESINIKLVEGNVANESINIKLVEKNTIKEIANNTFVKESTVDKIVDTKLIEKDKINELVKDNRVIENDTVKEIIEEKVENSIKEYGIYVVQPGDNIWNIHFRLLKDYFKQKKIPLPPLADEPTKSGLSSGVGKLLKFSEQMVSIYNILENTIDVNINLIEPMSKIVVYNMNEVFDMLNKIDYSQAKNIQFDGETIWLPVKWDVKIFN